MRDNRTWALAAALSALSLGLVGCAHQPAKTANTASSKKGPAGATTQIQPTDAAEPLVRNDTLSIIPELAPVSFAYDSGLLDATASATLRKNADWLKANEGVRVQVAGRCDQRGTVAYNLALGQRRATSVRDYYIKLGVSGGRVATISYGKEDPVCEEASEECWSKNRTATTLKATPANISGVFSAWPRLAQLTARTMIEKYGLPQEKSAARLRWTRASPWKTIVVTPDAASPLEQTVAYTVPAEKADALRKFQHGLSLDTKRGTMTARGDSEAVNRLTLNLAHDVASGKMTPAQAERFFTRELRLEQAGKSSPDTERLLF